MPDKYIEHVLLEAHSTKEANKSHAEEAINVTSSDNNREFNNNRQSEDTPDEEDMSNAKSKAA